MNIIYNIGDTTISEVDMHIICEEIIELLKKKKVTLAVANAILIETEELLKKKAENSKLNSFD